MTDLPINQIVCGDCLEMMRDWPDKCVDLVCTDPPYGIAVSSNHGASWQGQQIAGDSDSSLRDRALIECRRLSSGPILCFGSWKTPVPLGTHTCLVFDKGPAFGMGDLSIPWKPSWEQIYVIGKGQWLGPRDEAVLRGHVQVTWESKGRVHQNQKPLSLMSYLLSKINADVILDPFCGSGTTCVAAKMLGRKYIGIDVSEDYCRIARERLRAVDTAVPVREARRGQLSLFGTDGNG
jgi:DNA modification methylase